MAALLELMLERTGYVEALEGERTVEADGRIENLQELVSVAHEFEAREGDDATLELFLEEEALTTGRETAEEGERLVTLMTLHAAKGLEFDAVAIIGVEDGLLPHQRAREDEHELEEERRLCFVGITRAMRCLILSHARYRLVFGQSMPTIPSRFLEEFPANLIECNEPDSIDAHGGTERNDGRGERAHAGKLAGEFPPGSIVRHPDFGLGRVLHVAPMGAHTRARITFNTAGTKTLILQYARLAKVEEFTENGF